MSARWTVSLSAIALAAAVSIAPQPTRSCGPNFPNRMLDARGRELLRAPLGDIEIEFARIAPAAVTPFKARPADKDGRAGQTADADLADLADALTAAGVAGPKRDRLLADYRALRDRIREHARAVERSAWCEAWVVAGDKLEDRTAPVLGAIDPPAGLPAEFDGYVRGAIAFHQGRLDQARRCWLAVLDLPPGRRRARSTWSAYMLARSAVRSDPAECVRWCGKVRELAAAGFADRTGLAAASLGLEASAELARGRFERACELYLEQQQAGDATAVQSLRELVWRMLAGGDEALRRAAADPKLRAVMAAYVVARGGPSCDGRYGFAADDPRKATWLAAIEAAGVERAEGADRLAWAAYQLGQMDAAARWLRRAQPDSPVAMWVSAKLHLRAGRLDDAAALLAKVSRAFPPDQTWNGAVGGQAEEDDVRLDARAPGERAAGELAVIRLARRQYVDSLDLLLRAGWWEDAAYVAERILSVDELAGYVDANWSAEQAERCREPLGPWASPEALRKERPTRAARDIRALLARRLTRGGRWKQARAYFPPEVRPTLDAYVAAIRAGHDRSRPAAERGESLWQAALIARWDGLKLLATELGPDCAIWDGSYPDRFGPPVVNPNDPPGLRSADEQARAAANVPTPDRRFHYRYTAAEHAWSAAELMPDQSDRTALVLWQAGRWLAAQDPEAADRFYKALVIRCGRTPLGRQADERRWFPPPNKQWQMEGPP